MRGDIDGEDMTNMTNGLWKGIVMAGGTGSRLLPLTATTNKHLLTVHDRPMIHFPIQTLTQAGIRDILIITSPAHLADFESLLGDGGDWGARFQYAVQPSPGGIAQAFPIGARFIGDDPVALILGDNLFFGDGIYAAVQKAMNRTSGATVMASEVPDPAGYGIVELSASGQPISIEEKPQHPKSRYAVTGLYFYDHQVLSLARDLRTSARGELEITDLNQRYLQLGQLHVETLPPSVLWYDAGTHADLCDAIAAARATRV